MDENLKKISKFKCCGNVMVTVIIDKISAHVMTEGDYNRIIETKRKFMKENIS